MDFAFTPDQLAIRETIRELVQDKVVPRAAEIDLKSGIGWMVGAHAEEVLVAAQATQAKSVLEAG